MTRSHRNLLVTAALVALYLPGGLGAQPASTPTTPAEFQRHVDEYGRLWTMTDGRIDLSRLDRFYAPDANVTIIDFVPPGISRSWAEHRDALQRQLFSGLVVNSYVPRQDLTLRQVAPDVAVTTFTFDYANKTRSGGEAKVTGRQTNVWQRTGDRWVIVHEHGSPVPGFETAAR